MSERKPPTFGAELSAAAKLELRKKSAGAIGGGRSGGHQLGKGQKGKGQSASAHGINQGNLAKKASASLTGNLSNAERTMAARKLKSLQSANSPKKKAAPASASKGPPKQAQPQQKMIVKQLKGGVVKQIFPGLDKM